MVYEDKLWTISFIFSRAEENLINDIYQLLIKRNTQIVAEKFVLKVNGEICEVETIIPYPTSYSGAVATAKLEKEEGIFLYKSNTA